MTALEVLGELEQAGVTVAVWKGHLVTSPKGAVPQALVPAVAACKEELVELLIRPQRAGIGRRDHQPAGALQAPAVEEAPHGPGSLPPPQASVELGRGADSSGGSLPLATAVEPAAAVPSDTDSLPPSAVVEHGDGTCRAPSPGKAPPPAGADSLPRQPAVVERPGGGWGDRSSLPSQVAAVDPVVGVLVEKDSLTDDPAVETPPTDRERGSPPRVEPGVQRPQKELVLVETADALTEALCDVLAACHPVVALDLETFGDAGRAPPRLRDRPGLDPLSATIRLAQFTAEHSPHIYVVDLARTGDPRQLQPLLEHALLLGHNLKFEIRMLHAAGIQLPDDLGYRVLDTMVASQVLGAGRRQEHSLRAVAERHLGLQLDKTEQAGDWSGALTGEQLRYAADDVRHLFPLLHSLSGELEEAGLMETFLLECRAVPATGWLEQSGVLLDEERWLKLAHAEEARAEKLVRRLDEDVGQRPGWLPLPDSAATGVNWRSARQVLEVLRERGHDLESTSRGALTPFSSRDPLIPLLLEFKQASKRATTYGTEYVGHRHPVTGRVHPDWFQLGADAGRMSCERPNLQQVPRTTPYRSCFQAFADRRLVKCDWSAIEMRIAAEIARDKRLFAAFEQGIDIHRQTAATLMGKPIEAATKDERQRGKAANFGLLFGMGASGLRSYARLNYGVEMTPEEAQDYRQRFFDTYRGLKGWHDRQPEHAIATRTLGGRRRLDILARTEKLNSPVQGTGADMLKAAMGRIFETRGQIPGVKLILAIHDELVVEVPEDRAAEAAEWLAACMREEGQAFLPHVPVEVEVGVGRTWAGEAA